jgi:NAD+ diphosphatase
MLPENFEASANRPDDKKEKAWWFIFSRGKLLTLPEADAPNLPFVRSPGELDCRVHEDIYLGQLGNIPCYAADLVPVDVIPEVLALQDLRQLYGRLPSDLFAVAFRGLHLLDWSKKTHFCGRCGNPMADRTDLLAKECTVCKHVAFPRISPAVIVLVEQENKVLLARSPRFKDSFYSVLAGFAEPGETLEQTVAREVREETGIAVQNIRYFGSQPWPFPDSLMIGFTAQYAGGEIRVDGAEILEARWFPFDQLPKIPGKISIARELIDWFVAKHDEKQKP